MHAAATMTLAVATVVAVMGSGIDGGDDDDDGNHDDTFICPCTSIAKYPSNEQR
jgi:hypothetical protein